MYVKGRLHSISDSRYQKMSDDNRILSEKYRDTGILSYLLVDEQVGLLIVSFFFLRSLILEKQCYLLLLLFYLTQTHWSIAKYRNTNTHKTHKKTASNQ